MSNHNLSLSLPDADATKWRAQTLGQRLTPGDVILLDGDVGVGKTHFARALIQSVLEHHEDVPSPTFTLVQSYDTPKGEVWHADLYRVTSSHEIEELGLTDAFDDAICLIEWPDRLGSLTPKNALHLSLENVQSDDSRIAKLRWTDPKWNVKLDPWQAR